MLEYAEQNKNQFAKKESVTLESIFIAYGNNKKAALIKSVNALKDTVAKKNFDNLIKKYSDSPSVGTIERGQLMPIIEETVFNLNTGEISHLIEVGSGIYIFKLTKQNPSEISNGATAQTRGAFRWRDATRPAG